MAVIVNLRRIRVCNLARRCFCTVSGWIVKSSVRGFSKLWPLMRDFAAFSTASTKDIWWKLKCKIKWQTLTFVHWPQPNLIKLPLSWKNLGLKKKTLPRTTSSTFWSRLTTLNTMMSPTVQPHPSPKNARTTSRTSTTGTSTITTLGQQSRHQILLRRQACHKTHIKTRLAFHPTVCSLCF